MQKRELIIASLCKGKKKYQHLQNFKLASSWNEYALHVKHAGWASGPAPALFCRSILFIPFSLMHILSGRRGIQFPCNSAQDVQTYTKTGLTNRKIHLCPCVGLAACPQLAVSSPSCLSPDLRLLVSALRHHTVFDSVSSPHWNYSGI